MLSQKQKREISREVLEIWICLFLLLVISISSSGCCVLVGVGMKDSREKRKADEAAFHDKINRIFDKVSQ